MNTQARPHNRGSRPKETPTFPKATPFIAQWMPPGLRGCPQSAGLKPAAGALLLCFLTFPHLAAGQSVLAPPPPVPPATPPAMLAYQTNLVGTIQPPQAPPPAPERPPLEWGPLSLRPHLLYRFYYGNGIQSSPGAQETTAINELSPGLFLGLGRHFTLDYTPTWRFYSNNKFEDTLDHNVMFTGGATYEDWVLGLSQSYSSVSVPLVETGTQTPQVIYHTALSASYRFNSKMSTDLAADQTFASTEGFSSYREWATTDWLNYQFWPRLDAGIGLGFGYDDVEDSPNMTFERFQARINWRATDKTRLQVRGGLEDRQFLSGGAGDLLNPVAGASLEYRPVETTTLSLNVDRTVSVSYFVNQVVETTSLSANLSQRLLKKLNLTAGGGYANSKYVASTAGTAVGREDNYYFLNVRLSMAIRKRATVAVFYMFSDDSSNEAAFSYTSSQGGFELAYRF